MTNTISFMYIRYTSFRSEIIGGKKIYILSNVGERYSQIVEGLEFMKYIEKQILDLLSVAPLKIYDFPFCHFPTSLRTFLSSCVLLESDIQFKYFQYEESV